jgi:hypothetical protein
MLSVGIKTYVATMEINMEVPQDMNIELSYDSAIPLFGMYLKEFKSAYHRDTCTPMFIAAQFTIAKLSNQSRCPSADGV